jgi:signal transduction histidine kinase
MLESSARTDQATQAEIHALRQRVAQLEQALANQSRSGAASACSSDACLHLEEFLGIISHELKNPLTTINGNIQIAKRCLQTLLTEEHSVACVQECYDLMYEMLSRAEQQVRIQNRLVNDLLDASRLQTRLLTLDKQPHNLLTLIRGIIEDIRTSMPQRIIALEAPDISDIPVQVDSDRIGQVLMNYLTNALKYADACQPVVVRVEVKDQTVRVAVEDKGPGIPTEQQQYIWQRFYKVPGIRARNGSGTGLGLGLYICRTLIEYHGGQVGVESEAGRGSTFWFTLPLRSKKTNNGADTFCHDADRRFEKPPA